jgi:protein O-mannosyl-transferase
MLSIRYGLLLPPIAVFVFLLYANALDGPFVFDDRGNILHNQNIRIQKLTWEGLRKAASDSLCSNRPVANISFAANYYCHQCTRLGLYVGYRQAYRLVNILIHIATGILLYLLIKTVLNLPATDFRPEASGLVAFSAVLIWLVHPLHTQAVVYIVQRMAGLASMFYALAFLIYIKARLAKSKKAKWALFAGCALSGVLAVGSKEIAATLPFFILLFEWFFFQDLSRDWLKRRALLVTGGLILFALAAFAYLGDDPLGRILSGYNSRDFTLIQRVLTEFSVVIYYVSLLFLPHPFRLNLDYHFPLSSSLVNPVTTLLAMGAVFGLIGLASYLAKKNRLIAFAIFWFLGNLVIESSVISLEIIFEHRNYLPSMFVSLLAVVLISRFVKSKLLRISVLCAFVLTFAVWTNERNNIWSDGVALWQDCVEKSPAKARPHTNLGNALRRRGKPEKAVKHYAQALEIEPGYDKALLGMSFAEHTMKKKAKAKLSGDQR